MLESAARSPSEARRPGESAVDLRLERRTRGRLAQAPPRAARRHGRRSRARPGGREPRRATSRSPSRPAGHSRSSGRASTLRLRDAPEPPPAPDDGARRALRRTSAAAPARRARPRPPTRRGRPPASRRRPARRRRRRPACPSTAPGDGRGGAGPRRCPQSVRGRFARSRPGPRRAPTTSSGWVKRIAPSSRSITCAATAGSSTSVATPARSRSGLRRRAQRRGEPERLRRRGGKPGDPRAHELFERLRNRQRPSRVDVRVENAGQLEREERVPARPLVDAEQRLAGERPAEPVPQEPMERADAERPHRQAPDGLRAERPLESRRLLRRRAPPGEQQAHGLAPSRAERERQRVRRRGIEPLEIVDRDEERPVLARATAARCESRSRARADRPRSSAASSRRSATSSARRLGAAAPAGPRRGRPRTDRPAQREPGRARLRPVATRARAIPARAHARRPQARASTSRSPPRPRARVRTALRRSSTKERTEASSSSLPMIGVTVATSDHGVLSCSLPEPTGAQLRRPLWYEAVTTPHRNRSGERRRMEAGDSVGTVLICVPPTFRRRFPAHHRTG